MGTESGVTGSGGMQPEAQKDVRNRVIIAGAELGDFLINKLFIEPLLKAEKLAARDSPAKVGPADSEARSSQSY